MCSSALVQQLALIRLWWKKSSAGQQLVNSGGLGQTVEIQLNTMGLHWATGNVGCIDVNVYTRFSFLLSESSQRAICSYCVLVATIGSFINKHGQIENSALACLCKWLVSHLSEGIKWSQCNKQFKRPKKEMLCLLYDAYIHPIEKGNYCHSDNQLR